MELNIAKPPVGSLTRDLLHTTGLSLAQLGPMPSTTTAHSRSTGSLHAGNTSNMKKSVGNPKNKFLPKSESSTVIATLAVPLDHEWPTVVSPKPLERNEGLTFDSFDYPDSPKPTARSEQREFWSQCQEHYEKVAKPQRQRLARSREEIEEKKRAAQIRQLLEKLQQNQRKMQREKHLKKLDKLRHQGQSSHAKQWKPPSTTTGPTLKLWVAINDDLSQQYETKMKKEVENKKTVHYFQKIHEKKKTPTKHKHTRTLSRIDSIDAIAMGFLDGELPTLGEIGEEVEEDSLAQLRRQSKRAKRMKKRLAEREKTEREYQRVIEKQMNAHLEKQWGVKPMPKGGDRLLKEAASPVALDYREQAFPWGPSDKQNGLEMHVSAPQSGIGHGGTTQYISLLKSVDQGE